MLHTSKTSSEKLDQESMGQTLRAGVKAFFQCVAERRETIKAAKQELCRLNLERYKYIQEFCGRHGIMFVLTHPFDIDFGRRIKSGSVSEYYDSLVMDDIPIPTSVTSIKCRSTGQIVFCTEGFRVWRIDHHSMQKVMRYGSDYECETVDSKTRSGLVPLSYKHILRCGLTCHMLIARLDDAFAMHNKNPPQIEAGLKAISALSFDR